MSHLTEQTLTSKTGHPWNPTLLHVPLKIVLPLVLVAALASCPHTRSDHPPQLESSSLQPRVSAAGIYHTVAPNENLSVIARTYDVNLQLLAEVNNLKPPYTLRPDSKLFIPSADKVKPVEPTADNDASLPRVQDYSGLFAWPVRGKVTSEYGVRGGELHNGISIEAIEGTPVTAAGDGKIGHVGTIPGFGNVVLIEHANRIVTVYAHLKETRAKPGSPVKVGTVIGTVGSTGRVQNPSLYFEVRAKSKPRNPLFFLPRGRDEPGTPIGAGSTGVTPG
ncbi:MAG: LysM peptidoglycan-binding domain-containing M23 family metallopeptidase [Desulfomonilaceae bacterium]|nr:LysM peptidoglycan-binding domain-containing M23 family metallopeptidase [Desulfomonilaceae bacterium]